MLDPVAQWTLLTSAAWLAGAVNSIAGGGTLFTFSSLMLVLGPIAANATSTTALLPGSLAASWGYRRELRECRAHLWRLGPPSLIGGIIGSLLLARLPERVFSNLVPWLLFGATVLLLVQPSISRKLGAVPHQKPSPRTMAAIVLFQLLVGIYGGYFGAGIGILMLSTLGLMGMKNIHEMNALKTVLAGSINGVAVVIFLAKGLFEPRLALAMMAAAILGGYLGARFGRKVQQKYIRWFVIAVGFSLAAWYFWQQIDSSAPDSMIPPTSAA